MAFSRFPFSFPNPNQFPFHTNFTSSSSSSIPTFAMAAVLATLGAGISIAATSPNKNNSSFRPPSPAWATMSLSDAALSATGTSVDPKTGAAFPTVIDGTRRRLVGIGVRRKSLFGLKNIDVYAFGVYADADDVKELGKKCGGVSVEDVLDEDVGLTVRLQIVYGRLSIKSVRNAFEESVGSRLRKFSQLDNKELLQRFTSIFKDEYKIPRGTQIDLSREQGFLLRTKIDGKEIGSIKSKLLCKSIFDLYIGEDPFDKHAKEESELGLASLLKE